MKIFVCIKQVPDTETKIKISADGNSIDSSNIKWIVNPYDEYAIEEALKIKEANQGSTVTVFTVGPKKRVVDCIRTAIAMGVDEGVVIDAPESIDNFTTAVALSKAIIKEGPFDLILTGKMALDDNSHCVSQMLAEELKVPHLTVVTKLSLESGLIKAERESEGGAKEVFQITGSPVVAANKGLNTPRYASLPGIMKAKKKVLKELDLTSLEIIETLKKVQFVNYSLPAEKPPVKMITGGPAEQAKTLVKLLRDEAKAL